MASATKDTFTTFGNDFTAQTGTALVDIQQEFTGLFDSSAESTASKIVGGLAGISATTTVTSELTSGTIKIGFPKEVRDFPKQVIEKLEIVLSALRVIKTVLEAIRDLVAGIGDAIKLLLEQIFKLLEDLITMFTSIDCQVRVLPVPPIHPAAVTDLDITVADAAAAVAFCELISVAYRDTNITKQFPEVDVDQLKDRLLGASGPSAKYTDGSKGFLAAINDSFNDAKDPNRPVETVGYSAGVVIQAGAPTTTIYTTWARLKRLLIDTKGELTTPVNKALSPRIQIFSAQHTGFDENNAPLTRLSVTNPDKLGNKNLLSPPASVYLPVWVVVLTVENTDASQYPVIRESGHQRLSEFNKISVTTAIEDISAYRVFSKVYQENLDTTSLSKLGLTAFKEDTLELSFATTPTTYDLSSGEVRAVDALYKIRATFKRFDLKGPKYEEAEYSETDPALTVISNVATLHLPLNINADFFPAVPTGPSPNWIQYGKKWQIPGTEKLITWLKDLLADLKSFLSASTNILTAIINSYIVLIEKLTLLVTKLSNFVYEIDALLDLEIGANYMSFVSDNGVTGIKKVINDYYSDQESKYAAAKIAGNDTSDFDWFASGESVCGAIILGTSESAEKVKRLVSFILMLIASDPETDSSGQSLLGDTQLSGNTFTGDLGPLAPTVKSLFSTDFAGTDSSDESPEKACPS